MDAATSKPRDIVEHDVDLSAADMAADAASWWIGTQDAAAAPARTFPGLPGSRDGERLLEAGRDEPADLGAHDTDRSQTQDDTGARASFDLHHPAPEAVSNPTLAGSARSLPTIQMVDSDLVTATLVWDFVGTDADDVIVANHLNNKVIGNGGSDSLFGGDGADQIFAGAEDAFTGDSDNGSNLLLDGGAQLDFLYGGDGDDNIYGGEGHDPDVIIGNGGNDSIDGGAGTDSLYYTYASSFVVVSLTSGRSSGGDGNDTIRNIENLFGSTHNDFLFGNADNNIIQGEDGNDQISGESGSDELSGGAGDDFLWVGHYGDFDGSDETTENDAAGGTGRDELYGADGHDVLSGDGESDLLIGNGGNDTLHGGEGEDTASYEYATGAVTVDLGSGTATGADGNDTLSSIENLVGTSQGDVIRGSNVNNRLSGEDANDQLLGRDGRDSLQGGAGNDVLEGGSGSDLLRGGTGVDRFVYEFQGDRTDALFWGYDEILDFEGPGAAAGDIVDLSQVDADLTTPGDQAFQFGASTVDTPFVSLVEILWDVEEEIFVTGVHANIVTGDGQVGEDLVIYIEDGDTPATAYTADDFML